MRPAGTTDQKVGGSNPSGRAHHIAFSRTHFARVGDLARRSHPISCPIDSSFRHSLCSDFGRWTTHSPTPGVMSAVSGSARPIASSSLLSRHEEHPRFGVGSAAATGGGKCGSRWGRTRSAVGRSIARSRCTAIGAAAEAARDRWAAKATLVRSRGEARPAIVVGDLLGEWFDTDHGWRPSTELPPV